jgi:phosphatidate cytidylyltransferase
VALSGFAVPLARSMSGGPAAESGLGAEWMLLAVAAAVVLVLVAEMARYRSPGGATAAAAISVFTVVYVGLMIAFAVRLRVEWGLAALASLLVVVKASDIGAYTVGRLVGRHKMSPRISPGKTLEGAAGAVAFACLASWLCSFALDGDGLASAWGWIVYGTLLAGAGMAGDLAESLLKRDVGRKDSSLWLPGFGGVLDMVDSVLLAAPVAYTCWRFGLVGG